MGVVSARADATVAFEAQRRVRKSGFAVVAACSIVQHGHWRTRNWAAFLGHRDFYNPDDLYDDDHDGAQNTLSLDHAFSAELRRAGLARFAAPLAMLGVKSACDLAYLEDFELEALGFEDAPLRKLRVAC